MPSSWALSLLTLVANAKYLAAALPSSPAANATTAHHRLADFDAHRLKGARVDSLWQKERQWTVSKDRRVTKERDDDPNSPFSKIGRLEIQLPDNQWSFCTATLVAPHLILTARHCVQHGWSANYAFWRGGDEHGTTVLPWLQGREADEAIVCGHNEDWALMMFPREAPYASVGHLDVWGTTPWNKQIDYPHVALYGFSADADFHGNVLSGMPNVGLVQGITLSANAQECSPRGPLRHFGDATWGQGGAPLIGIPEPVEHNDDPDAPPPPPQEPPLILGIHAGADDISNMATWSYTLGPLLNQARRVPPPETSGPTHTLEGCQNCTMQSVHLEDPYQDRGPLFSCVCQRGDHDPVTSSVDLDRHFLGTDNGAFVWFSNGYQAKCRNYHLDQSHYYQAECRNNAGDWVNTTIDLSWYLTVDWKGALAPHAEFKFTPEQTVGPW